MRRALFLRALLSTVLIAGGGAVSAQDRPPLSTAIRAGDTDAVARLLKQRVDVNAAEGDGSTALHWAAYHDRLEVVDQLIRAGAHVNVANDLGATPLWAASMNGTERIVSRLLQAGADPNLALLAGETPLMVAARGGFAPVVSLLLSKGAKVDATATRRQTALMWAVSRKHPAVTKLLIDAGASLHLKSATWSQVMAVSPHGMLQYNADVPHGADTALLFAARNGDLESARILVAAGANADDADAWGVSATALAAHAGHTAIVELLLEKGANPNTNGGGFTALHAAVMRRDERMVAALLAHGADPNAKVLHWTPTRRSSRDWNFNPELVGATPYWLAARALAPAIMRMLVARGADAHVVHHAVYHAGDPTEERSQTTTPLMAAVGMGGGIPWVVIEPKEREALTLETAKLALELGVDINRRNDDGRTALDAATRLRYSSVVAFLTERGGLPGAANGRNTASAVNR
ncbi:MAG: ankyrin repeat domain-containing protein [Vicinamibacterales bacterium]